MNAITLSNTLNRSLQGLLDNPETLIILVDDRCDTYLAVAAAWRDKSNRPVKLALRLDRWQMKNAIDANIFSDYVLNHFRKATSGFRR